MQAHDLIQVAEVLIIKNLQFTDKYKDWCALPDSAHTWDHFQEFWQQAYNIKQ